MLMCVRTYSKLLEPPNYICQCKGKCEETPYILGVSYWEYMQVRSSTVSNPNCWTQWAQSDGDWRLRQPVSLLLDRVG